MALSAAARFRRRCPEVDRAADLELLERAKTTTQRADLLDGLVQNLLGRNQVALPSELAPAEPIELRYRCRIAERASGKLTATPMTPCRSRDL